MAAPCQSVPQRTNKSESMQFWPVPGSVWHRVTKTRQLMKVRVTSNMPAFLQTFRIGQGTAQCVTHAKKCAVLEADIASCARSALGVSDVAGQLWSSRCGRVRMFLGRTRAGLRSQPGHRSCGISCFFGNAGEVLCFGLEIVSGFPLLLFAGP